MQSQLDMFDMDPTDGSLSFSLLGNLAGAPWYLVNASYRQFVNIGICGGTGCGKSSLVNALLNFSPGDIGAAPVGTASLSNAPVPYIFNDELIVGGVGKPGKWKPILIWDLPGAGCKDYPQDTYCKDLGISYFDLVIVVSSRRITEIDKMLVSELQHARVPYFVVRTKMDIDVKNDHLDFARQEEETMNIVRKSLLENDVIASFLVSPRRPTKFELHQLCLNIYAWIMCHVRQQVISDLQCPVCTDTLPSMSDCSNNDTMMKKVVQWKVEIDRTDGEPLGVDVDSDNLEVVEVLEEGLIPQWNKKHANCAVKVGDRFRAANDVYETNSVIEECKVAKLLRIAVVREVSVSSEDFDLIGGNGNASSLLQGLELRPRRCYHCETLFCFRCVSMLALECNGGCDAICPSCNRLMSGTSNSSSWMFGLDWWWS